MLTSISSNSTVQELLSLIKLSVERKGRNGNVAEEAERILIRREEDLANEVRDLKVEVNNLKNERDVLETLRGFAETEKISMEWKLKERKVECEELSERVNRLIDEHKSLVYGKIKAEEMYRIQLEEVKRREAERMKTIVEDLKKKDKEMEEVKRVEAEGRKKMVAELKNKNQELEEVKRAEAEGMKTMEDLKRKNEELEKEIMHYRDNFEQRISNVEEIAAGLLGKDVSDAKKGNYDDRNSCRCASILRSCSNSGGNHSSHRQNQDHFADICDVDVSDNNPVIGSPIAAVEGPNNTVVHDVDVSENNPVIGSPIAAVEGPNNTVVHIIDSDDESTADESAVIAQTNDVNLNSSLKEMPSVNTKMPSVKTGKKNETRSINLVYRRKQNRSLGRGDEIKGSGEVFHDDKGLFSNSVDLDSTLKKLPSVNKKMPSVNTEDKNGLNQSFDLVHGRNTYLNSGDEAYRSVLSSQKMKDIREFFDDDNALIFNGSTNGKSVAFGTEGNVTPRKRHLEINNLQEIDGKYDQPSSRKHIRTDFHDCTSSDSDDGSTAESGIDNIIAKLRKKAWKTAADLVSEFDKNHELCMKAVCALYRRTVSDENLTTDPSIPATPGLSHFIAMGGKELAELLTKGDRKHRLRSNVAELKTKRPEALVRCRELAIHYTDKLFEIYGKGEDPFFCCACL